MAIAFRQCCTDPSITLLSSQVQVNSTFSGIDPNTKASDSVVPVVSIWTTVVRDERIDWIFVSGTVAGQPTGADFVHDHRFGLIDSVNDEARKAIDAQFNSKIFRDTAVTASSDGVLVSATVWTRLDQRLHLVRKIYSSQYAVAFCSELEAGCT